MDEVVGEEFGEGFGELDRGDVVVVEQDAVEEDLVVHAADFRVCELVGSLAAGGEVECLVEHGLGLFPVGVGVLECDLDLIDLACESVLLFFEEVEGDGVGVVGVHEFALLVVQGLEAACLAGALSGGVLAGVFKGGAECCADYFDAVGFELDGGVLVGDAIFDLLGEDVGLGAAVSALPPGAEEVEVVAFGVCEQHAGVAAGAVDAAFEVVVVDALAFAGEVVGLEDVLDAAERFGVDEWLVGAVVLDAAVGDFADVVALVQ